MYPCEFKKAFTGNNCCDCQIASGEVFGPDQPIALKLLGSERSLQALEGTVLPSFSSLSSIFLTPYISGVAMELEDSLFPLLREVSIGIDSYEVFQDADWALLIGAKPRGPGMERAGLLDINGQIFAEQVFYFSFIYQQQLTRIQFIYSTIIAGKSSECCCIAKRKSDRCGQPLQFQVY